jgi:curved DNA-binding protein CbpA
MNFYEEFGLSPLASMEEIRQAHKNLARLLHPDHCQDEHLRSLAESQMKRLNAIYAILSNPEERQRYNSGLAAGLNGTFQPPQSRVLRNLPGWFLQLLHPRRYSSWALAALLGVLGIYWHYAATARAPALLRPAPVATRTTSDAAGPQRHAPPRKPAMAATVRENQVLKRENRRLREKLERVEAAWNYALQEQTPFQAELEQARQRADSTAPDLALPPALPRTRTPFTESASSLAQPASPSLRHRLSGTWYYARRRLSPLRDNRYPPDYIEVVIVAEDDIVRGRYRGRYRVSDRAISPEVAFQFGGKSNDAGRYPWMGAGGAKGEVRLRLTDDDFLAFEWIASDLGSQMGLGSGTAVLVRRLDP